VTSAIFEKNSAIWLKTLACPRTRSSAITGISQSASQSAPTRIARAVLGRTCSGTASPSMLSITAVLPPGP
jgi:hypothetical protein